MSGAAQDPSCPFPAEGGVAGFLATTKHRAAAVQTAATGRFFGGDGVQRPIVAINHGTHVTLNVMLGRSADNSSAAAADDGDDDDVATLAATGGAVLRFPGDDALDLIGATADDSDGRISMKQLVELPQQTGHVSTVCAVPYFGPENRELGDAGATRHALFVMDDREDYRLYSFAVRRSAAAGAPARKIAVTLEATGCLADPFHHPARNSAAIATSHVRFPVVAVHTYERIVRVLNFCALLSNASTLSVPGSADAPIDEAIEKARNHVPCFNARIAELAVDDLCFAVHPRTAHVASASGTGPSAHGSVGGHGKAAGKRAAPTSTSASGGGSAGLNAKARSTAVGLEETLYGLDLVVLALDRKKARRVLSTYAVRLDVAECVAIPGGTASVNAAISAVSPGNEVRDLERAANCLVAFPRGVAVCGPTQLSFFVLGAADAPGPGAPSRRRTEDAASSFPEPTPIKHENTVAVPTASLKRVSEGMPSVPQLAAAAVADLDTASSYLAFTDGSLVFFVAPDRLARAAPPRPFATADGASALIHFPDDTWPLDARPVADALAVVPLAAPAAKKPRAALSAFSRPSGVFVGASVCSSVAVFVDEWGQSARHVDAANPKATLGKKVSIKATACESVVTHDNLGPVMCAVAAPVGKPTEAGLPAPLSGIIAGCGAGEAHSYLCHIRGGVAATEIAAVTAADDDGIRAVRSVFAGAAGQILLATTVPAGPSPVCARLLSFTGSELSESEAVDRVVVAGSRGHPSRLLAAAAVAGQTVTVSSAGVCVSVDGRKLHDVPVASVEKQAKDILAGFVHPDGITVVAHDKGSAVVTTSPSAAPTVAQITTDFAAGEVGDVSVACTRTNRVALFALWQRRDIALVNLATEATVYLSDLVSEAIPLPRAVCGLEHGSRDAFTVLVGGDNGQLHHTTVALGEGGIPAASPLRSVSLGASPVSLAPMSPGSVLACGDLPAIVDASSTASLISSPKSSAYAVEASRRVNITSVGVQGLASAAPVAGSQSRLSALLHHAGGDSRLSLSTLGDTAANIAVTRLRTAGTVTQVTALDGAASAGRVACAISNEHRDEIAIASVTGPSGLHFLDDCHDGSGGNSGSRYLLARGEVCTGLSSFTVAPERVTLRDGAEPADVASPTGPAPDGSHGAHAATSGSIPVLVATTAFLHSDESRCTAGRVIIFALERRSRDAAAGSSHDAHFHKASSSAAASTPAATRALIPVVERDITVGAPYAVCQADVGRILVAVNGSVCLFKLRETAGSSSDGSVRALQMVPMHTLRVGVQIISLRVWRPYETTSTSSAADADDDANNRAADDAGVSVLVLAGDAHGSVSALTLSRTDDSIEFFSKDMRHRLVNDHVPVGGTSLCVDDLMNFFALDLRVALRHPNMAPPVANGGGAGGAEPAASPARSRMKPSECLLRMGPGWHCADRVNTVVSGASTAAVDLTHIALVQGSNGRDGTADDTASDDGDSPKNAVGSAESAAATATVSTFLAAAPCAYGTVCGAIGAVVPITASAVAVLSTIVDSILEALQKHGDDPHLRRVHAAFRAPAQTRTTETAMALAERLRAMKVDTRENGPSSSLAPPEPSAASRARGFIDGDVLRMLLAADIDPKVMLRVTRRSSIALFGSTGAHALATGKDTSAVRMATPAEIMHLMASAGYRQRVVDRTVQLSGDWDETDTSAAVGPDELASDDDTAFLGWTSDALVAFVEEVLSVC